jgi:uncharacterized protein (TIGR03083 family)
MEYEDHIAAVERETAALAAALAGGDLSARVPTCPDWTVADLAEHVGGFTGFWTHVLCDGSGRPKAPTPPQPSDAAGLAAWYRDLAGSLVQELRATPPDTAVWTWVPDRMNARFVGRRAAHELAVHRFDAQSARGTTAPIDGALAADGIEEIFVMMAAWDKPSGERRGETLHLHGTDRENEWLITLNAGGVSVQREHAKGDLALRGAVSDLELMLYQRPPLGDVQHFGDDGVLDAWYREFTFG